MFRISISGLALLLGMLSAKSQSTADPVESNYKKKELKVEEINLISSYYTQDGNNSAVTGGIGSEKLRDWSNMFELKLIRNTKSGINHRYSIGIGYDAYTSASSDKIDTATTWSGFNQGPGNPQVPNQGTARPDRPRGGHSGASSISSTTTTSVFSPGVVTSASLKDKRIYPSVSWSVENPRLGLTLGVGASYSTEWDYRSKGANLSIIKVSKDKNMDLGLTLSAYLDHWLVIYPAELRPVGYPYGGERDKDQLTRSPRNTYAVGLNWNQVINKKLQVGVMLEPSMQQGLLGTTYQRVYFANGKAAPEKMPDQRTKYPLSLRASYFIGDFLVLRPYYRYYADSWDLHAHTLNMEASIKAGPFVSFIPFCRYYTQNGVSYFAPYKSHLDTDAYYTSDYDLSKFTSNQYGMGVRIVPLNGVMGVQAFNSLELRYSHYDRSNGLSANIVTAALSFK